MPLRVHFMGIGGSGASAAAAIAQNQGFLISGCDQNPYNEFTGNFDQEILYQGHSANHLANIDLLAISPAVISLDPDNEELSAARGKNIPIMTWQQFMGKYLEQGKFVIAICGTHGKSTTTAMIGLLLEDAGLDPTVELGAVVPKWGSNYRIGQGKPVLSGTEGYFVTEADEFNNNFLATTPDIAVVTTIEMDHPESFEDFADYKTSFRKFLSQTKELIVANQKDNGVTLVLNLPGKTPETQVKDYSKHLVNFPLKVMGEYNRFNASAAYQVGLALNIDPRVIKKSLGSFTGIDRRFEYLGDFKGAKIYSDFGHHPTEIKVTVEAAREKYPSQKITVVFQPHMFSRTLALKDQFIQVLRELPVNEVIVMDIYPSREIDKGLINSQQLVEQVDKDSVIYVNSVQQLFDKLRAEIKGEEVIFFIGAGDTDKWARKLVNTKF